MVEQFKCDELTRGLCQLLPKIDDFDQKVKVAEMFRVAPTPLDPCTRPQKHYVGLHEAKA